MGAQHTDPPPLALRPPSPTPVVVLKAQPTDILLSNPLFRVHRQLQLNCKKTPQPNRDITHAPAACCAQLCTMAIMDYIQSGVEKVLRPKRGGIGGMGPGIGSSTGVAQFQDEVRSLFLCTLFYFLAHTLAPLSGRRRTSSPSEAAGEAQEHFLTIG